MDENDLASYRPVSNLPFITKTLERVVNSRLDQYLKLNNLLDEGQTAYSKHNSTETALISVQNHILINMDEGKATVLVMLDLSAAYDTVQHKCFIQRLANYYGFADTALSWMRSYVEERQFKVSVAGKTSSVKTLDCGVPQGAVLGGKCFNMYTAPIGEIASRNSVERKGFADDNQGFVSFTIGDDEDMEKAFQNLQTCLYQLEQWLLGNMLKLNQDKTKLIFFAPKQKLHLFKDYELHFGGHVIKPSTTVKNLGAFFDKELTMEKHINTKVKSAHFQIRNLWIIRKFLTEQATKSLVVALVLPKIDYCNGLLAEVPKYLSNKLQRVQNSAARLIKKVKKRKRITPTLKDLHWLPVIFRIKFKINLLTYKTVNNLAPPYLCNLISDFRRTRNDNLKLIIPTFRRKRIGGRAFKNCAPRIWNALPLTVRSSETVSLFKKALKTYYFNLHYNS